MLDCLGEQPGSGHRLLHSNQCACLFLPYLHNKVTIVRNQRDLHGCCDGPLQSGPLGHHLHKLGGMAKLHKKYSIAFVDILDTILSFLNAC